MTRPLVLSVLAAGVVLGMLGCEAPAAARMQVVRAAYQDGDYARAYNEAVRLTHTTDPALRTEASYIAGLAAHRRGSHRVATQYLQAATRSADRQLAGDALAELGLIHAEQQRYALSARTLLAAAERLDGQDRANAYFYAGAAQQKLGRWDRARTSLSLARSHSTDPLFRQQVDEQLSVTGYTLQIGAFANQSNAQRATDSLAARARTVKLGVPRIVPSTDRQGQRLYLVQIGRFSTFAAALIARQRLGSNEPIIVPLAKTR